MDPADGAVWSHDAIHLIVLARNLFGERSFQHVVALVFAATLAWLVPWYSLPILCTGFALYGPARYAWAQAMQREKVDEELF